MATSKASSGESSTRAEWAWNASPNPFSKTEPPKWRPYSDVENNMIEQAFAAKQDRATLDEYYIDFAQKRQISNVDKNRQRPVQRTERNKNDARAVRNDRYLPNPVDLSISFNDQCGFISYFIKEVAKFLKITKEQLPSKDHRFIPMIVERAANGIIEEGTKVTPTKQREASFIGEMLREKKNSGIKEIWEFCANLYTWDSFLYKQINETMRLIGNPQHDQVWRSKVSTIGPYCLLLWDNPFNSEMIKPGTMLYRGAQVPDEMIKAFQAESSREPKIWHTFEAFTSCTQNRSIAEQIGNVLFIMKTRTAFTLNLTQLSEYRQEEEEVLLPGISFTINQVSSDKSKNKYLVYLSVHQRHISKSIVSSLPNCRFVNDKKCLQNEKNSMLYHFLEAKQQKLQRPTTASTVDRDRDRDRDSLDRDNFDRDMDRMNLRDNPPAEHGDLLAALACPTADYNDLSLLIYRYGRDMDWK